MTEEQKEVVQSGADYSPLMEFDELEQDTLKEIGNISLGSAATILSQLISRQVSITTPSISYRTAQEISTSYTAPCLLVEVEYVEGIFGNNLLIIEKKDAVVIGQLMMMDEPDPAEEITEIHMSAVSEAMNQMMGSAATAMSNMFDRMINISSPRIQYKQENDSLSPDADTFKGNEGFIQIAFKIEVEGLINSELVQLMPVHFAHQTADFLLGRYQEDLVVLEPEVAEETLREQLYTPSTNIEPSVQSPLDDFSEMEKDTLKEIGNISLGSSATTLSQLIMRQVNITTPVISYKTVAEINASFKAPCLLVKVEYVEGITGNNLLIIAKEDAVVIGQLMMMEEPSSDEEITEIHISAVSEAMNQMMGASATAMSDMFDRMINISSPQVEYRKISETMEKDDFLQSVDGFIQIAFKIEVQGLINSELIQLMPIDFAHQTANFLLSEFEEETSSTVDAKQDLSEFIEQEPLIDFSNIDGLATEKLKNFEQMADDELTLIKNISLEVKGVVGRIKMPLEKILKLDRGSVIELDSGAGNDVEILINGKKIAYGEIVAVGDQYGLRLCKIFRK